MLPESIALRRAAGGEAALGEALRPTVETALRESVRKDPGTLADALFPVMGPAIRRSILQTLRSFFDSFNEAMDHSFSLQRVAWRFEALRTGRSFSGIILLHSLVLSRGAGFPDSQGDEFAPGACGGAGSGDAGRQSGFRDAFGDAVDFVRDSFHARRTIFSTVST